MKLYVLAMNMTPRQRMITKKYTLYSVYFHKAKLVGTICSDKRVLPTAYFSLINMKIANKLEMPQRWPLKHNNKK